ncbi:putative transposase, Ptta/En/Spm, plant [Sesbania bispinosa]|nr:putative transposase, Ptta/En/Spm, plant [Sesbania bispinosa]
MKPIKKLKKKKRTQAAVHTSHASQTHIPLIVPSSTLQAHTNQPQTAQSTQSHPRSQLQSTQAIPQPSEHQPIPTQVTQTVASSSSHVSGNKIKILPEEDGFDRHRLVVGAIASIIRSKFEEAKPSWKKITKTHRDTWYDIFKSKFAWSPQYDDIVRRNFEKRGAAKMTQIMQEVRKDLDRKPHWMGELEWEQLKAHWESYSYKERSQKNKRNHESIAGASLHTGGSIPHRLHWKRMREETGVDPSLTDFYFRTHRKKDQSWVGPHAKSAYEKFEMKKAELSSQNSENIGDGSQQPIMPSDIDIWIDSVGEKKGRIFGFGSLSKSVDHGGGRGAQHAD